MSAFDLPHLFVARSYLSINSKFSHCFHFCRTTKPLARLRVCTDRLSLCCSPCSIYASTCNIPCQHLHHGPQSVRQRNAIRMAFRWRANSCPMFLYWVECGFSSKFPLFALTVNVYKAVRMAFRWRTDCGP